MKIAIMGSGGVGGYYGARLARAGEDVHFIARGAHLQAMQRNGLKILSSAEDFHLSQVSATDDPASIGVVDLVIMSVKTYGLEEATQAIKPIVGEETAVIPLLNGVDNAERIGEILGPGPVMGGVVFVSAFIAEPGVIRHVTMDRLLFGELAGGTSPRAEAILAVLKGAGIGAELSTDIRREIWNKFIFLASVAGVASAIRAPAGQLREDPEIVQLFRVCGEEALALARKLGVELGADTVENAIKILMSIPAEAKPSMLLDLEAGNKLELEALQGTLVRLGKEQGVPTPISQLLYTVLKTHAAGAN